MIGSPLKNIIRYSISGVPYDVWAFPGLIFILGSIVIFPPLFREFFDLRMHGKSLINIALTPHSKTKIVFSNLVVAIVETIIVSILTGFIYTSFIEISFSFLNAGINVGHEHVLFRFYVFVLNLFLYFVFGVLCLFWFGHHFRSFCFEFCFVTSFGWPCFVQRFV